MRVVHVPDGAEPTQGDDTAEGTDGGGGEDTGEGKNHAGGEYTGVRKDHTGGEDTGEGTVLATDVELAESTLALAKGLRFRSSIPEDYAFVMEVGGGSMGPLSVDATLTTVDMLFVRFPIDVVWVREGSVVKVKTMHPWRSLGLAKADRIVELPAGGAEDVEIGDTLLVENSAGG